MTDVRVLDPTDARAVPLEDESVAAVVTSPPYNLDVAYDGVPDRMPWPEYEKFALDVGREVARLLVPSGRAWVNVMRSEPERKTGGTHKNGQWGHKGGHAVRRVDLARIWETALAEAGLEYRDTVVWVQDSHDGACSWGSFRVPSAPNLRGDYEVVLSFYKPPWLRRPPKDMEGWRDAEPGWETICRNVWRFAPAPRNGHPAPFPPELPARCVRLSTWPGEVVYDPFGGYGATPYAAAKLGRRAVVSDLSSAYTEHLRKRFGQATLL